MSSAAASRGLVERFEGGLDAPICLTWELTYACNLACVHCLSSSGRRYPRELSTEECKAIIDELQRLVVRLEQEMRLAATELRYEEAALLRDDIAELRLALAEASDAPSVPRTSGAPGTPGLAAAVPSA